ncbi:glycosyltransferase family 4 protein [Bacteroidota bacterium]
MKRVLIITYYWPPSGGAGVQRWLKFSKFLPDYGWDPIILTVDPKFASYPVLDASLEKEVSANIRVIKTRSREWFSVYKKVSNAEKIPYAGFANEVKKTSFKEKVARFVRGNFFLPDPRKGWNRYALSEARKLLQNEQIDCIVTSSPPHSTQLIGLTLTEEFDIPWIADLRDPWTDIYYYKQFYPTWLAHRFNLRLEKLVLSNAAKVITVGQALKELFESKIKNKVDQVQVITNGYDPDDFRDIPEQVSNRKFTITYVGTMAEIYPFEGFLEAFRRFTEMYPDSLLRFIGTVSPGHRNLLAGIPEENVELIPYVDHRRAIEYMSNSSVLLLVIPESKTNRSIVTGKLFEYIAVRRPILLLGPFYGDASKILRKSRQGIVYDPKNITEILELLEDWKQKLPEIQANDEFSRKHLTQKLVEIFEETSLV